MGKKYFEIDTKNKTFIFTSKNYAELYNAESEVAKAFKAMLSYGCYEGFVPVEKESEKSEKSPSFNEAGVATWIEANNPEWQKKWDASKEVKMANNEDFSFMVRRNYFLSENPEARAYCGMKEPKGGYKLTKLGESLKSAVETKLANKAKK